MAGRLRFVLTSSIPARLQDQSVDSPSLARRRPFILSAASKETTKRRTREEANNKDEEEEEEEEEKESSLARVLVESIGFPSSSPSP